MKNQLIKTLVRGLYLTIDGKVWHKSAKREVLPNEKGKVRYNGKLYDLKKITIDPTQSKSKTKPPVNRRLLVSDLLKLGYKKTHIKGLYLTNSGKCYNTITKHELNPSAKGYVIANGIGYNLAKLVLATFKKEPIRTGRINFKNGNPKDFYFENLEYKSTPLKLAPNDNDLIQCIRFYFSVESNFTKHHISFKYYLSEVVKNRGFNHDTEDFLLFLDWIAPLNLSRSQSKQAISKKYGYSVFNGANVINGYLLQLVNECFKDFEAGVLKVKEFIPKPPRKKSNAQLIKEFQKSFEHLKTAKF